MEFSPRQPRPRRAGKKVAPRPRRECLMPTSSFGRPTRDDSAHSPGSVARSSRARSLTVRLPVELRIVGYDHSDPRAGLRRCLCLLASLPCLSATISQVPFIAKLGLKSRGALRDRPNWTPPKKWLRLPTPQLAAMQARTRCHLVSAPDRRAAVRDARCRRRVRRMRPLSDARIPLRWVQLMLRRRALRRDLPRS